MGLKGKIEAVIYAAEEPVTIEQISLLVKQAVLHELAEGQARAAIVEAEAAASESAAAEPQEQPSETSPEQIAEPAVAESGDQSSEPVADVSAPEAETPQPDEAAQPTREDDARGLETPDATELNDTQSESTAEPSSPEIASAEAVENAAATVLPKRKPKNEIPPQVKARVREILEELISDYASSDRGMEIRRIAGGFRMATKPEHHDVVKAFAKSLKPPLRLSLPALETLAVVAYKQPVTAPEVSEIRGVDSQGVIATLLDRKLITTAGRKAVIGRPILYKTTKEFLLRFGLKDVSELPSMEEFEKLAQDAGQVDMFEPEDEPAGQSTLHDAETGPDSEAAAERHAAVTAEADADTAESVVSAHAGGEQAETPADQPASEEPVNH